MKKGRRTKNRAPANRNTPVRGDVMKKLGADLERAKHLYLQGRATDALALYRGVAKTLPGNAGLYHTIASLHLEMSAPELAMFALRRALLIDPALAPCLINLGAAARRLKDVPLAIKANSRALTCAPGLAEGHHNLGDALEAGGDLGVAEMPYRRAVLLQPDYGKALYNFSKPVHQSDQWADAARALEWARILLPFEAGIYSNLGSAYSNDGKGGRGLAAYRRALTLDPASNSAWYNRANLLHALGQDDEALAGYKVSCQLAPVDAGYHWNRALALLLSGRLQEGWEAYEWRWHWEGFSSPLRDYGVPRWDGGELQGRKILVHAEQGLGDTIHFSRYLRFVKERGGYVIFECQPALKSCFETITLIDELMGEGDPWPDFDFEVPLMSVPGLAGTSLQTAPPAPLDFDMPPADLPQVPDRRLKVGLVWGGNPEHRRDHERSTDLKTLMPLLDTPGVQFYSLQHGDAGAQITAAKLGDKIIDLGPAADFLETAGRMMALDLVISVDTAPAHLAATLNVPTWIMVHHIPDWRWLKDREDSIWYSSVRLFRQKEPGDWPEVVKRLATALNDAAGKRA